MTVVEFWRESRWRDLWHVVRYVKVGGRLIRSTHSGLDVGANARESVPALRSGRVVDVGRLSDIGWYVTVQVGASDFDIYCHVLPDVTVGQRLTSGQHLCRVAGWGDDHGAMWSGPHLHFMVASTAAAVRTRITRDPAPVIRSALTVTAGEVDRFIEPDPILKEDDMKIIRNVRQAVGEHLVFFSPSMVSVGRELSTIPAADRDFDLRVARALNGGVEPELWDETHNGGWYLRRQMAYRIAGMPPDYPLSPTNPFIASRFHDGDADAAAIAAAVVARPEMVTAATIDAAVAEITQAVASGPEIDVEGLAAALAAHDSTALVQVKAILEDLPGEVREELAAALVSKVT